MSATIPIYERSQPLLLSYPQQRLWFLDRLQTETSPYNELKVHRLIGPLDVAVLQRSLSEIVRRHESLRTTFVEQSAGPLQVVTQCRDLPVHIVDLSHLPVEQQGSEIKRRAVSFAALSFNLARDLMLRTMLLRFSPEHHVLLRVAHHIATDGWSSDVFWKELSTLYTAFAQGLPSPLAELPVQYADFAQWQRRTLQGAQLDRLLAYWKEQLSGLPEQLTLATDRPRPAVVSYRGDRVAFSLSARLTAELRTIGRRERATLYMTLLAAWQLLLCRYSGQSDIVVGSPVAGRNRPELEGMIGFFVNTLLLRVDLSGEPTFLELLQRVRKAALGAYAHPDLPFEKLVEELRPERSLSHSPLCQVLFAFQNTPRTSTELLDVIASEVDIAPHTSKFDLTLSIRDSADGLSGWLEYSSDLFDRGTIERMAGHLQILLEGIVADPQRRLSELPLLTAAERQQLLVEFNNTEVDFPRTHRVHHLFEEQVERTPDAVAVVFQEQEVTYRELNERANQLAHFLRKLDVGPETLVGLCLERSVDLVVGILGIWKAGGAYVPLAADYPPPRLKFMLQDSKVDLIVAHERLRSRLREINCRFICLDSDAASFQDASRWNPTVVVGAHYLAYVMYTSGSTGQPKGVQIPHSAVVNLLTAMAARPGLTPNDRLLAVTTPTFDISVLELLLPLTVGARLHVLPSEAGADATRLAAELSKSGATVMQATPATWQMLIHGGWNGSGRLKALCGGEALVDSLIEEMLPRCGELWNMYGPTETTIWSTTSCVGRGRAPGSIGRPIANTTAFVLDCQRQLVPIGVPGELYIAGAGLARGYLNRPELTAEKFVQSPFSDDPASRLYRTGDLCRWRGDGNLEFLGRLDDQVKLRGFRIELGEIESVLNKHPAVAQGIVVMREDRPGDKRLVAYCVPAADAELDFPTLKSHLRTQLPDYMLPAALVSLPKFPLTSSGKIDRRALPAPEESRPELDAAYVAPSNAIEQQLASVWCELLTIDRVGVDDDFFELGGHSLMAVRLFSRIEESFGRKLPLAVLFQQGTIRHLARLLAESGSAVEIATALPLHPGIGHPLFLMPSIGGELLFSRSLIDELDGRFPIVGIQPALIPRNQAQFSDFRATARRFVCALRTYQPHGPYSVAGFSYGGLMAFEVACQLTELGEKVDLLVVVDTGPGRRGSPAQFFDNWRWLLRVAANLPFWLRDKDRGFSAGKLVRYAGRMLRRSYHWLASRGRKNRELDDVFDVNHMPQQNLELMRAVYAAFRDYVPRHYSGQLTLFRANAQPLLAGNSYDLGWGRFVNSLDVRLINGNHESIIHRPYISELARQLGELLDARARCLEPARELPEDLTTHPSVADSTKDRVVGV